MTILCYCKDFAIRDHARNVETVTKVTPVLARFLQNEVVQSVTTCHPCSGELIGGIEHGLAPQIGLS